jgi:hypothetical protein
VAAGENEVQQLFEEMLDIAGGASRDVQRATRIAYSLFLRASDVVNNFGQPQVTGHTTHVEQVEAIKGRLETARKELARIVPKDLL